MSGATKLDRLHAGLSATDMQWQDESLREMTEQTALSALDGYIRTLGFSDRWEQYVKSQAVNRFYSAYDRQMRWDDAYMDAQTLVDEYHRQYLAYEERSKGALDKGVGPEPPKWMEQQDMSGSIYVPPYGYAPINKIRPYGETLPYGRGTHYEDEVEVPGYGWVARDDIVRKVGGGIMTKMRTISTAAIRRVFGAGPGQVRFDPGDLWSSRLKIPSGPATLTPADAATAPEDVAMWLRRGYTLQFAANGALTDYWDQFGGHHYQVGNNLMTYYRSDEYRDAYAMAEDIMNRYLPVGVDDSARQQAMDKVRYEIEHGLLGYNKSSYPSHIKGYVERALLSVGGSGADAVTQTRQAAREAREASIAQQSVPPFTLQEAQQRAGMLMGDTLWEGEVYDIAVGDDPMDDEERKARMDRVWNAVVAAWAERAMKYSGHLSVRDAVDRVLQFDWNGYLVSVAKQAAGGY